MISKLIRRIGYLIISLALMIILFEVSLRMAGYFYYSYRLPRKKISKDIYTRRILCLGDSFTFGLGAKKGYSYPEQLQRLLNNDSGNRFTVYNAGIPGVNSSSLYKNSEADIKKYQPDIIIIMTGINDNVDFMDSNYFLFLDNGSKTYLYQADAILSGLRSYKLLKAITLSLIDKISFNKKTEIDAPKHEIKKSSDNQNTTVALSDATIQEAKAHFELAQKYEKEYKYKLAIKELKYSIQLNPNTSDSHALMGFIYLHRLRNFESAIKSLNKSLEIDPLNTWARDNLMKAYHRANYRELALDQARELSRLDPKNQQYRQLLKFGIPVYGDLKPFYAMIKYDLNNIRNLLISKKITLILQNYPAGWPNDTLREFAIHYRLLFVDNETVFHGLRTKQGYFAEDGHCNEDGNYIIAVNVYNLLKSQIINIP